MKFYFVLLSFSLLVSCGTSIRVEEQYPDFRLDPKVGLFDASSTYSMVQRDKSRREKFCRPNKKFLTLADSKMLKPEHKWVGKKRKRKNNYVEYRKKGVPFARAVAAKTGNYLYKRDPKSARKAVDLLLNWAETNELYVRSFSDVGSTGGARGASAALNYILPAWHILKYSNQASTEEIDKIETWLDGVVNSTKKVRKFTDLQAQADSARHHIYFGVITENTKHLNYGVNAYAEQLRNIRPDGSIKDASQRGRAALRYTKNRIISLTEIAIIAKNNSIDIASMKNKSGVGLLDAINFFERAFSDNRLIDQYAIKNVKPPKRHNDFLENSQVIGQGDFLQVKLVKSILAGEGDFGSNKRIFNTANLQCVL